MDQLAHYIYIAFMVAFVAALMLLTWRVVTAPIKYGVQLMVAAKPIPTYPIYLRHIGPTMLRVMVSSGLFFIYIYLPYKMFF